MIILQTHYIDDCEQQRFVGRFICDACEQPITEGETAWAFAPWNEEADCPKIDEPIRHAHGRCYQKVEEQVTNSGSTYHETLKTHILDLVESSGLTLESLLDFRDGGE